MRDKGSAGNPIIKSTLLSSDLRFFVLEVRQRRSSVDLGPKWAVLESVGTCIIRVCSGDLVARLIRGVVRCRRRDDCEFTAVRVYYLASVLLLSRFSLNSRCSACVTSARCLQCNLVNNAEGGGEWIAY